MQTMHASGLSLKARAPVTLAPSRSRHQVRVRAYQTATEYQSPSASTAASELEALARVSELVPDTLMFDTAMAKPTAATVSCALLRGITNNPSVANRPYENAIATAVNFDQCSTLSGSDKLACQLDKALTNVGAIFAGEVSGRVCTEVDPRLANNADDMVERALHLVDLYQEMGVPRSKLIMRLPGTWEGIQAAGQLEKKNVATQVSLIYSMVQGVAAAQAGTSVIQPNVGRVRDWYNKHPGVIRDPKGPREDSGFSSRVDPGVSLVQSLFTYVKKFHPSCRIMASGLRTKDDALALAGCDYLILAPKIMSQLAGTPTLQGYNDSLSASDVGVESPIAVPLTLAAAVESNMGRLPPVTKEQFDEELGIAGGKLLDQNLQRLLDDVEGILPYFSKMTVGTE